MDPRRRTTEGTPLTGVAVVTLAANVPGPVAAARLAALGARVTKVEPPAGDPLAASCRSWYDELVAGQTVLTIDLKSGAGRARLDALLADADLLLTANRPAALRRLGLDGESLRARFPRLARLAVFGHPPPQDDRAGHDLTFQAAAGLLAPPALPHTLVADLAAAERLVSAALALLLAAARGAPGGYAEVTIEEAAHEFAAPLRHGLTAPGAPLGGGEDAYGLYRAADGWVALAALEPHFRERVAAELGVERLTRATLEPVFLRRTAAEWERWAIERDVPLGEAIDGRR